MLRCPCSDFADCVRFARLQFQDWFNVAIKNLLHQHPLDEEADGVPYWSQKKRPPTPEDFSLEDELHASFIVSSACLYARLFSIPESSVRSSRPPLRLCEHGSNGRVLWSEQDLADYAAALEGFKVPQFDESQATFVPANEEERKKHEAAVAAKAEEDGEDLDTRCQRLTETLPTVAELGTHAESRPLPVLCTRSPSPILFPMPPAFTQGASHALPSTSRRTTHPTSTWTSSMLLRTCVLASTTSRSRA